METEPDEAERVDTGSSSRPPGEAVGWVGTRRVQRACGLVIVDAGAKVGHDGAREARGVWLWARTGKAGSGAAPVLEALVCVSWWRHRPGQPADSNYLNCLVWCLRK